MAKLDFSLHGGWHELYRNVLPGASDRSIRWGIAEGPLWTGGVFNIRNCLRQRSGRRNGIGCAVVDLLLDVSAQTFYPHLVLGYGFLAL